MDRLELERRVAELLGFRVRERENDAVVEVYEDPLPKLDPPRVRSVRPATKAEVTMYLRTLGFVARIDEQTTQLSAALKTVDDQQGLLGNLHNLVAAKDEVITKLEKAIEVMGMALQKADVQIKDLLRANHGLGEEREERQKDIDGLNAECNRLGEANRLLQAECDSLLSQRDAASSESASARLMLDELTAEVKELKKGKGN